MIKIRIEGSHEECLAAADKIRRAGIAKIHVQSKFYPNRGLVELADTFGLRPNSLNGSEGSSPSWGTINLIKKRKTNN